MTLTDQAIYELEKCLQRMKFYKKFPGYGNYHALTLRASREVRYILGQWNNTAAQLKNKAEKDDKEKLWGSK
jgi:hypothetical protein